MDDFLFHPERLAGYPVTLEEARRQLNRGRYNLKDWMTLDPSEAKEGWKQSQVYIWWKLASGDLHSFAQAKQSGAWYRLPAGYWIDHRDGMSGLAKHVSEGALTDAVEAKAYLGSTPAELVGEPVIVWREDIDRLLTKMPEEAEAYAAFMDHVVSMKPSNEALPREDTASGSITPPLSAIEEEKRIAAQLDADGVSKRDVKGPLIAKYWVGMGPKPSVLNVQSFMTGRAGGRPSKTDGRN